MSRKKHIQFFIFKKNIFSTAHIPLYYFCLCYFNLSCFFLLYNYANTIWNLCWWVRKNILFLLRKDKASIKPIIIHGFGICLFFPCQSCKPIYHKIARNIVESLCCVLWCFLGIRMSIQLTHKQKAGFFVCFSSVSNWCAYKSKISEWDGGCIFSPANGRINYWFSFPFLHYHRLSVACLQPAAGSGQVSCCSWQLHQIYLVAYVSA